MKVVVMIVIYIVTAIIFIGVGYILKEKHSAFPKTDIGVHIACAMKDKKTWETTNRIMGVYCIISGIAGFVFLPIIVYLTFQSWTILMIQYFISSFFLILGVFFVVNLIVDKFVK